MNIYKRLADVQNELKAPKNQHNSFGKYNYRSCEDILVAAKPLCIEKGLLLTISDRVEIKENRYYIVATATVIDIETEKTYSVEAYAREEESKKGMDGAQVTGASSSYARKYALNGLFCIDDTKDADTDEHKNQQNDNKNNNNDTQNLIPSILKIVGDDMERMEKIEAKTKKSLIECSEKQLKWIYSQLKQNKI